jgi:hypothetical protein
MWSWWLPWLERSSYIQAGLLVLPGAVLNWLTPQRSMAKAVSDYIQAEHATALCFACEERIVRNYIYICLIILLSVGIFCTYTVFANLNDFPTSLTTHGRNLWRSDELIHALSRIRTHYPMYERSRPATLTARPLYRKLYYFKDLKTYTHEFHSTVNVVLQRDFPPNHCYERSSCYLPYSQ